MCCVLGCRRQCAAGARGTLRHRPHGTWRLPHARCPHGGVSVNSVPFASCAAQGAMMDGVSGLCAALVACRSGGVSGALQTGWPARHTHSSALHCAGQVREVHARLQGT